MQLSQNATRAETILAASGITLLARVWDSTNAFDVAVDCANKSLANIRCVSRASLRDYRALATMIAEGPFDHAILVYSDKESSVLSDEIETWHIDDIEHLVARLAAEVAA